MSQVLEAVRKLGVAVLDAWVVVDAEDKILEHNALFRELFPRSVGRGLVGRSCRDTLQLSCCAGARCVRALCEEAGSVRLDEQEAEISGEKLRFIVGASKVELEAGRTGTLIVLRNVTEEARVQAGYQQLEDSTRRQCEELEERLDERTRDLLMANDLINRLERELARYKRGEV